MGAKVTVDSASLMNKALELIEAHWLFGVEGERLHALIHPQSIVHGMVEFVDGSVLAHLAMPDMKIPIQHALTYPNLRKGIAEQINWSQLSNLEFEEINHDRYGAIQLAYDVISRGGTAGAVFNAANEVVVNSFLQNALPFGSIIAIVEEVLKRAPIDEYIDFNSLVKADHETRELTTALIAALKVHS
jgi:1-deoxy-D-xylulose-5-phosphate reductoisomerase